MKTEVKVYTLHEKGLNFIEIAKLLGMTAQEASRMWVKADIVKTAFKEREKVVYRKRLSTSKSNHKKLVMKMRTL